MCNSQNLIIIIPGKPMDFNAIYQNRYTFWRRICLWGCLLFQVVFGTEIIAFFQILLVPPPGNISYEYWGWYLNEYVAPPYQDVVVSFTDFLGYAFAAVFILALIFAAGSRRIREEISVKFMALVCAAWLGCHALTRHLVLHVFPHYRLFMRWIPLELLSIVLLIFWARTRKTRFDCKR